MLVRKFVYSAVLIIAVIGIGLFRSCENSWAMACGFSVAMARLCIWQQFKKAAAEVWDVVSLYRLLAQLSGLLAVVSLCLTGVLQSLLSATPPPWPVALVAGALGFTIAPLISSHDL